MIVNVTAETMKKINATDVEKSKGGVERITGVPTKEIQTRDQTGTFPIVAPTGLRIPITLPTVRTTNPIAVTAILAATITVESKPAIGATKRMGGGMKIVDTKIAAAIRIIAIASTEGSIVAGKTRAKSAACGSAPETKFVRGSAMRKRNGGGGRTKSAQNTLVAAPKATNDRMNAFAKTSTTA